MAAVAEVGSIGRAGDLGHEASRHIVYVSTRIGSRVPIRIEVECVSEDGHSQHMR
jgi:hypothetical protein